MTEPVSSATAGNAATRGNRPPEPGVAAPHRGAGPGTPSTENDGRTNPCRLASLKIERMGRLEDIEAPIDERLTLIHGRCATGKSTLVMAAAVAMCHRGGPGRWADFHGTHQRNGEEPPRIAATSFDGSRWSVEMGTETESECSDEPVPSVLLDAETRLHRDRATKLETSRFLRSALGAGFNVLHAPGLTRLKTNPSRWSAGETRVATLFLEVASLLEGAYGSSDASRTQPAFVAVDDIDAHLHPAAQQRIVPELQRTFPGIQIVASTQSPLVITTARPEQLIELCRETRDEQGEP